MTDWERRVRQHGNTHGIDLADTVVEELAAHLEDAWRARVATAPDDPDAFAAAMLARADLSGLPRPHAAPPPAPLPAGEGRWGLGLLSDLRYTLRVLRRAPAFTAAVVAVLAVGLGATTAAFRVVHAALIAPLPYVDADRLVMVFERNVSRGRARNVINPGNFFTWSGRATSLDAAGVFSPSVGNLAGDGATPEELPAMVVQASVLAMTGVRPEAGRLFTVQDEEPSSPPVVLIDGGLWRRRFGGAPDAVGRTVVFNGEPATIVGVLPSTFHVAGYRGDVWRPTLITAGARTNFRGRGLLSLARLADGVTREQAEAELNGIFATLVDEHPEMNTGWDLSVVPVREQVGRETRPALLALFGAVGAVLLVACANIAALLLVRATARRHDLAVRVTLGAGPGQVARQVAVECLTLFALGGVLGAVVAAVLTQAMWRAAYDAGMVLQPEGGLNGPALAFAGGLTLLTGLACSLGPALRARRLSPDDLKAGGRSVAASTRGRGWLVAGEVAAAMLVLSGAALLGRSYVELQAVDPGFQADRVITARVSRMGAAAQASSLAFAGDVIARLQTLPGVTSAAATSFLPLDGQVGIGSTFRLGDRPDPGPGNLPVADYRPVTPGYFATLGIRMVAGRDFSAQDVGDRPRVAIVNETFVRQLSPDVSPLGRPLADSLDQTQEIVGVVADIALSGLGDDPRPTIYLPYAQFPVGSLTFVVRSAQNPALLGRAIVGAIREIDPNQPVSDVQPLADVVQASLVRPRVVTGALGVFGTAALLLAAIGVYGVVAYSVQLRRTEFGVRLALGATPGAIVALVVRQSLWLITGGVAAGAVLAVPLSGTLQSLLYGVTPGDPATLALVAAVIAIAGLLASYLPARRGTAVDPMSALRAE